MSDLESELQGISVALFLFKPSFQFSIALYLLNTLLNVPVSFYWEVKYFLISEKNLNMTVVHLQILE